MSSHHVEAVSVDTLIPQLSGALTSYTHLLALHAVFQYASETSRAYYGDIAQYAKAARDAEIARANQVRRQVSVAPHTRGAHSDAWWHGVSVCEQGGKNNPFFGYFSIMDGSAGGLPWGAQVGIANGIIGKYGDSAWASACVAAGYHASPSG